MNQDRSSFCRAGKKLGLHYRAFCANDHRVSWENKESGSEHSRKSGPVAKVRLTQPTLSRWLQAKRIKAFKRTANPGVTFAEVLRAMNYIA